MLYYKTYIKFVKLAYICILEVFRDLYCIKVTKLFTLTKFGHFEDFQVLYYLKVKKYVKHANYGIY